MYNIWLILYPQGLIIPNALIQINLTGMIKNYRFQNCNCLAILYF